MTSLKDKVILITGGTGSLGEHIITHTLQNYPDLKQIIVFSRDEYKQHKLAAKLRSFHNAIQFRIGDIRDLDRLQRCCEGVDIIIHTATLKHVDILENNPLEAIKTNVLGTQNLILAAQNAQVKKVLALSTDKAASPNSMYGASKLCAEKLLISANFEFPFHETRFAVLRCGNVFNSRGSVVEIFQKLKKSGVITVTDPNMTRFSITHQELVEFLIQSLNHMIGGEIFIPKMPSYNIETLIEAVAPDCKVKLIGRRPGEKIHEDLITIHESGHAIEFEHNFLILPINSTQATLLKENYQDGKLCEEGFAYSSNTNTSFLDVKQIAQLINES